MPRWYAWIGGALVVRSVGENASVSAAVALGVALLGGYWCYRVGAAAYDVPGHRGHAAWREVRRIASEVGEALLGWALILLVILGIVAIAATWPPDWKLVLLVLGLGVLAIVALVASLLGTRNLVSGYRTRRWRSIEESLQSTLRVWAEHVLSVEPTGRAVVERSVKAVYEEKRRGAPTVRWASSPPEFARLLEEAAASPPLHRPPPWWVFLLPFDRGVYAWSRIWDAVGVDDTYRQEVEGALGRRIWGDDTPRREAEAALAASIGVEEMDELVAHVSWFSFREDVAIVLEHPTEIHLDADGELHHATGPAVRFPDRWSVWALEGVVVPAEAIEDPESFDPRAALRHENLEVRRVLVEHLGWDRVVRASRLSPHAEDEHGKLWRLPVPDEDPVLLLEVENATPDPDGLRRPYFLRVPPDMRSPREATAWTFGLSELEYAPDLES